MPVTAVLVGTSSWGRVHAKVLSIPNTMLSLDVHVNRAPYSDFPEVCERKWDRLVFILPSYQKGTVVFFFPAVLGTEVSDAPRPLPWNKAEKQRGRSPHSHCCMP